MEPRRIRNAQSVARLGWTISAKGDRADIDIYDQIGVDFWGDGLSAADFIRELRALDVANIDLHINSPGGFVDDALAIYHALQQHPARVTAHIEGIAASAASFIAQAADERRIASHARVMIHDAQGFVSVFSQVNAGAIDKLIDEFAAMRDLLDAESDNIASIYAERAGGSAAEWRRRMQANGALGTTYRGQEAVDVGLADEVEAAPSRSTDRLSRTKNTATAAPAAPEPPESDEPDDQKDALGGLAVAMLPPLAPAAGYKPPVPDLAGLLEKHPLQVGG